MTDLSPQALATMDAYMKNCGWLDGPLERDYRCVAAVLRAAADTLVANEFWDKYPAIYYRKKLLAIAAELENQ